MQAVVPSSLIQSIPVVILGGRCHQFVFSESRLLPGCFSPTLLDYSRLKFLAFSVEVVPDFHQILRTSAALTLTLIPVAFCVCDIDKLQPANRLPDYKLYF